MTEDEIYEAYCGAIDAVVAARWYLVNMHSDFERSPKEKTPEEVYKETYLAFNTLYDYTRDHPKLSEYGDEKAALAAWIRKDLWKNQNPKLLRQGCKVFDKYNKALHYSGAIVLRQDHLKRLLTETANMAWELENALKLDPDFIAKTPKQGNKKRR